MNTISVTGHRPKDLPRGTYSLTDFAIAQLKETKPDKVITGVALGWDLAIAEACVKLKIPFIAAVPFVEQPSVWRKPDQDKYHFLLSNAEHVEIVCKGKYTPKMFQTRNEWMVDRANSILALWNGKRHGGTFNCIAYAEKKSIPIKNVWENFVQYLENK